MGTSKNSKTRFVIANEVKQSRVFVRILGRFTDAATPVALYAGEVVVPRRGVYPELTEGLLAMTFRQLLEVSLFEFCPGANILHSSVV